MVVSEMVTRRSYYGTDGKPLEWVIQDSILDYLMRRGAVEPIKFWRARPSQYIRAQGANVGFELHPSEVGLPDIMGVAYGFTIALEVKRPGITLNVNQKRWRDDFRRASRVRYWVVHDVKDAKTAVDTVRDEPVQPIRMVTI